MTIKAIETEYNGYRFRSRLEARWAVFFDAAGIDYQYEPDGFELDNNDWYLPDFYLPWFKCYVEIKPSSLTSDEDEEAKRKLEELFNLHGDCCAMICKGDPLDDGIEVIVNEADEGGGSSNLWLHSWFVMGGWYHGCSGGKRHIDIVLDYETSKDEAEFFSGNYNCLPSVQAISYCEDYRSDLDYAMKAARQARFEHGEKPVIAHA